MNESQTTETAVVNGPLGSIVTVTFDLDRSRGLCSIGAVNKTPHQLVTDGGADRGQSVPGALRCDRCAGWPIARQEPGSEQTVGCRCTIIDFGEEFPDHWNQPGPIEPIGGESKHGI